jgi:uncharacterized protein YdbL (DUF1318 family)
MSLRLLAPFLFLLAVLPLAAQTPEIDAVRGRMNERLPAVVALLRTGGAGEGNAGLLVARAQLSAEHSRVLAAENTDRTELYRLIGAREGLDPAAVARAQARRIAGIVAAGTWIQDEEGEWKRKG